MAKEKGRAGTTAVATTVPVDINRAVAVMSKDGSKVLRIDRNLVLSEEEGTMVKMPGMGKKVNGSWMDLYTKSADGWVAEAGSRGMQIYQPDTVVINGREMPNGSKDENGRIYSRAQAGGRTDMGVPFKTDRTIIYDFKIYNLVDLLAKSKKPEYKAFFKLLPKRMRDNPPGDSWAFYDVDEAFDLWVNAECPDHTKWVAEAKNREKTAERTAVTFAVRNAVKAHPAVSHKNKYYTNTAVIKTTCWCEESGHLWDKSTWGIDTTKFLEAGGKTVETDSKVIDITAEAEEDDEVRAEIAAESAGDLADATDAVEPDDDPLPIDDEEPENVAGKEPEPEPDVKLDELLANIKKLKKFKPTSFKEACKQLSVDPESDLAGQPVARLVELLDIMKAS